MKSLDERGRDNFYHSLKTRYYLLLFRTGATNLENLKWIQHKGFCYRLKLKPTLC